MQATIPETHKKPGVHYALTEDGIELPIIDVTHPAFAIRIGESELDAQVQNYIRGAQQQSRLRRFVQGIFMKLMVNRSRIMKGLMRAQGGFLSGIDTYLLKLGPDNLGAGYASDIDRQISGSLPGLSVRLRLQDIAQLLAESLLPVLDAQPGSDLHLLNIGGGPCIDSLNALLLIHQKRPKLLMRRRIAIHSLDLDAAGPAFGKRALEALRSEGAPLHGLDIRLEHVRYDWSETAVLRRLLISFESNAVVAASSEGALFEYGSDEDISANLRALHDATLPGTVMAGSVTRADAVGRSMNGGSRAAINMRGLEAFTSLAQAAGWVIAEEIDRPMSHDVRLKKG